jgi:hypothetical protein
MGDTTTETVGCAPRSLDAGTLYKWCDWLLVRTDDSIIVWCDACVLELRWVSRARTHTVHVCCSYASNGWLWFVIDGKLQRLNSNGQTESGSNPAITTTYGRQWAYALKLSV